MDGISKVCQANGSKCCREGKIFLTAKEVVDILMYNVLKLSKDALREFITRLEPHDGFFLYDQKNCCQFLDNDGLCKIYDSGFRPRECEWWPLHVYVGEDGGLEIRLVNCQCGGKPNTDQTTITKMLDEISNIGVDKIRRFRSVYSGTMKPYSVEWKEK